MNLSVWITFSKHLGSKSSKEVPFWSLEMFKVVPGRSTLMWGQTLKMGLRNFNSSNYSFWRICVCVCDILRLSHLTLLNTSDISDSTLARTHDLPQLCFLHRHRFHPTFPSNNIIQTSHTHPPFPPSVLAISGGECFETWSLLWHLVQQSQPLQARVHRDVERRWQGWVGIGFLMELGEVSWFFWVIGDLRWPI